MAGSAPGNDALIDLLAHFGMSLSAGQVRQLQAYVEMVFRWQRIANLTAAESPARFIAEHIADSLAVVPHLDNGFWVDVGSGAGLPGVVAAICTPSSRYRLVEPRAKRARFLRQVAIDVGLPNVEVSAARVQQERLTVTPDGIISRALGSLVDFVKISRPLCDQGTKIVAMKSHLDDDDLHEAERLAGPATVISLTVPGFSERNLVVFSAPRRLLAGS